MSDGFLPMEKTRDMSESYRILRYPFSSLWCRRQQTGLGIFLLQLHLLPICLNRFSCESCRGWAPQRLCRRVCCPHLGKTLHLNHVCLHHSSRQPSSTLPETLRSFSKTWFWQVCSLRILHLSLPGSTEKKNKGFGFAFDLLRALQVWFGTQKRHTIHLSPEAISPGCPICHLEWMDGLQYRGNIDNLKTTNNQKGKMNTRF